MALALVIWQIAAVRLGQHLLLVPPLRVLSRFCELLLEPGFWETVGFSFSRIAGGFFLGLILGLVLAIAAGRLRWMELLLWPYVTTVKAVPVASFIIISLVWLSSRQLSIFISFLMVFPIVYTNVLQGVRSADTQLLEMASIFRMPWGKRLRYIFLPHLRPYLQSACSVALGVCWKSGVAAEVIGIPKGSIGERLYTAKIYLSTADLFAWTVVVVAVSVGFEKLILFLLRHGFDRLERDGRREL